MAGGGTGLRRLRRAGAVGVVIPNGRG